MPFAIADGAVISAVEQSIATRCDHHQPPTQFARLLHSLPTWLDCSVWRIRKRNAASLLARRVTGYQPRPLQDVKDSGGTTAIVSHRLYVQHDYRSQLTTVRYCRYVSESCGVALSLQLPNTYRCTASLTGSVVPTYWYVQYVVYIVPGRLGQLCCVHACVRDTCP